VLMFASGVLRCWSVAEDSLVWEYQGKPDCPLVYISVIEVVEGGQAVSVIACFARLVDAFCW
jgi:hypothetical protein